jgi:uncharacterized membrane protein
MIGLPALYALAGAMFAAFAVLGLRDTSNPKRFGTTLFWGLMAVEFLAGDRIGDLGNGIVVVLLAVLAGAGALGRGTARVDAAGRQAAAARYGNRLFAAALIVPATALVGTLVLPGTGLADPKQVTLVALAIGVVLALIVCALWLRPSLAAPLDAGRSLLDAVGWAAVLPQALAALGAVFALAGVGAVIGGGIGHFLPHGVRLAAVAAYTVGMAGLTMVLGNAYAAFPVMTAGVALPLLVGQFGGDAAPIAALGMLSGFCGTLCTPMAANFNLVPVALLDLDSRYAVIRAQVGTALPLLVFNTLLMNWVAFR